MKRFIITTGLTSRLIEADTREDAVRRFRDEVPTNQRLIWNASDLKIVEATEKEADEFQRSLRRRPMEGQIALELNDERRKPRIKEPA